MLRTISAALLAVAVVATPALAAGSSNTTNAPAAKTAQKTTQAKPGKTASVQPKNARALNANAKMNHQGHHRYQHHRGTGATKVY